MSWLSRLSFRLRVFYFRRSFYTFRRSHQANKDYVSEMYTRWSRNPKNVHSEWQKYFAMHKGSDFRPAVNTKPSLFTNVQSGKIASIQEHYQVYQIIRAYQEYGHYLADLDPLQLVRGIRILDRLKVYKNPVLKNLKVPNDRDALYLLPKYTYIGGNEKLLSLNEILNRLDKAYCQTIGVEYSHMLLESQRSFVQHFFETPGKMPELSKEDKIRILRKLIQAYMFEMYLSKKWPSEKRFGIDGSESCIAALSHLVETASNVGTNSFIFGMAHRGRLNLLANVINVEAKYIFALFQGLRPDTDYAGDVKYHLGLVNTIQHPVTKKQIRMALIANASHLESQSPLAIGKARAEQLFIEGEDRNKVWPILIHGDAAVCGQGVVYESFHLSELPCFDTGGTVHIIFNNQIGFTTDPKGSRSSEYCTSVSRVNESPVFHVNGDDVDAVMKVITIAALYKKQFEKDVVVDIICYRRLGHNEADEPMFTQPLMYKKVKTMTPVHVKYANKLINENIVTKDEVNKMTEKYMKHLDDEFSLSTNVTTSTYWVDVVWKDFPKKGSDALELPLTGVDKSVIMKICDAVSTPPKDFNLHPALERIFKLRKKNVGKDAIDWAVGESLGIATLLQEGVYVRLTGQDVERGTFSHRHHVLHDQKVPKKMHNIIANIFPDKGVYSLCNSSLSEYGVLGFEIGMTFVNPMSLVMWEAQFGDFANSAQILIDQYISSGEAKWLRQIGITLLLPHGMEGMGPEHSSARIERFLSLCDDNENEINKDFNLMMKRCNWFVCNPSTPANLFHLFRRQVKLNYRKPLIVFTPKFLLRHPLCVSSISDFVTGTSFIPYINDPIVPPSKNIKKLILCSGKVYYELIEERKKLELERLIAISRVEQLSPLPYKEIIQDATENFPNARVCWVQEEHKNQGAWSYVSPRLNKAIGGNNGPIIYVGRLPSSTTGAGYKTLHDVEKRDFLDLAMNI